MLETLASLSAIRNSAVSLLEKTNLIYDAGQTHVKTLSDKITESVKF